MPDLEPGFWRTKPLDEMNRDEWEALCDGCAKCCLHRLEDEETREIYFTNVHCRLLNLDNGQCSDYTNRSTRVPDCVTLTPAELDAPDVTLITYGGMAPLALAKRVERGQYQPASRPRMRAAAKASPAPTESTTFTASAGLELKQP